MRAPRGCPPANIKRKFFQLSLDFCFHFNPLQIYYGY
uniref:Uncharacterized protein n=1 Tax=Rhizophora mucronata TaxID=61149 RepID=A0A2P2R318_RHIMU